MRRTLVGLITLILICSFLAAGCQTPQKVSREYTPVSDLDRELNRVKEDLTAGHWTKALARLSTLKTPESTGTLRQQALDLGKKDLDRFIKGGSWDEVQRIQAALKLLGEEVSTPGSWAKLIQMRLDLGWTASIPWLMASALKAGQSETEVVEPFIPMLEKAGLGPSLAQLLKGYKKNSPPPAPQLLSGTVTILVNKGLKIENGMGTQDMELGTGFFIDSQGYLLTNYHVIQSEVEPKYEGYSKVTVRLDKSKGERLPAKVVGWSPDYDLALLKVETTPEYVFNFALDQGLVQGDSVRALGSPGGLESTITLGIVSALKRPLLPQGDVIQVDVAINPGNSGGPLVNAEGLVVGIAFAGVRDFQGVNFGIPGHLVQQLLPRLYQGGLVTHVWLGAGLQDTLQGLEVTYVAPRSPADRLGLQVGDRLKTINGLSFKDTAEIQSFFLSQSSGALLAVAWERQNKIETAFAALDPRPEKPLVTALDQDLLYLVFPLLFGAVLEPQGVPDAQNYLVKSVYSGSPADNLGLSTGDPLQINDFKISKDDEVISVQIFVKKKLGGYLESVIQLQAYLNPRDMI